MTLTEQEIAEIEAAIAEAETVIRAFRRIRYQAQGRICPVCGNRFHPTHPAAETCSDLCRRSRRRAKPSPALSRFLRRKR